MARMKVSFPTVSLHLLAYCVCVCVHVFVYFSIHWNLLYALFFNLLYFLIYLRHLSISMHKVPALFLMALLCFCAVIYSVIPRVLFRLFLVFCLLQAVLQTSLHKYL